MKECKLLNFTGNPILTVRQISMKPSRVLSMLYRYRLTLAWSETKLTLQKNRAPSNDSSDAVRPPEEQATGEGTKIK
jgi:hypothetical protein